MLHAKKVWGVNGSSSSSLSYLLRVMDNGLLFIWTPYLQFGKVILVGIETLHFGRRYHIVFGMFYFNTIFVTYQKIRGTKSSNSSKDA